jgi:CheY-like chemotaxis protein
MLRTALEFAGFTVITGYVHDIRTGNLDLEKLIAQHKPAVIVWDIALPYESQWRFFQHIRDRQVCGQCRFVVTTTNARRVSAIAGSDEPLVEIVDKPYDLEQFVQKVKEAAHHAGPGMR